MVIYWLKYLLLMVCDGLWYFNPKESLVLKQNQQNYMSAQQRLRSTWASAQSDQSSLSAWRKLGSLATHWAHSEDFDQTGRIPRLIWVFVVRTSIFLVLSWGGTNWHVRPAKTQISMGIRPVWSESSLSAWRKLGSLATHLAHNEDSDQTMRMHRLIWVFVERTPILLVLSWGGSRKSAVPFESVFSEHTMYNKTP